MSVLTEGDVEQVALEWLSGLGWQVSHGTDIAPDGPNSERSDYGQVALERRALANLNPSLPADALDDAYRRLTRPEGATLEARNRAFHRMLIAGVTVEYRDTDGRVRGDQARAIDFGNPANNDWLAVNQFTVTENRNNRRQGILLFVNGLHLGVVELKNPADEDATKLQRTEARVADKDGRYEAGRKPGGDSGTVASASSGTRRVRARA